MSLPFLAGDSLELAHVGGADGRPDHGQVVDLRGLGVGLVLLEEELEVAHVLELYEAQPDRVAIELVSGQPVKSKKRQNNLLN